MNPFMWEWQHKVALCLSLLIGASLGTVLGYFAFLLGPGFGGWTAGFGGYVEFWWVGGLSYAPFWALFGAAIGGGIIYIIRLSGEF